MNWKTWFPLVLAIVLGVVAAKAANDWVRKNKAAAAPAGSFTKVIVANADMAPGRELKAEDLTLADFDAKVAPANAFKTVEEVAGRVNETFMVKGQPIVEAMLAPTGAGSGIQATIPEGQRAVTLEVNEFTGVAGLLVPNCRVDILSTMAGSDDTGQITRTIVQNVKVTAVGQRTALAGEPPPQNPNEMFRSVTVLVTPEQAERIELACSTSRPRLMLRGGRDNDIVATAGISIAQLRGKHEAEEPVVAVAVPTTAPAIAATPQPVRIARAETPKRIVKVIRGAVESKVTFDLPAVLPTETHSDNDMTELEGDLDPFTDQ